MDRHLYWMLHQIYRLNALPEGQKQNSQNAKSVSVTNRPRLPPMRMRPRSHISKIIPRRPSGTRFSERTEETTLLASVLTRYGFDSSTHKHTHTHTLLNYSVWWQKLVSVTWPVLNVLQQRGNVRCGVKNPSRPSSFSPCSWQNCDKKPFFNIRLALHLFHKFSWL